MWGVFMTPDQVITLLFLSRDLWEGAVCKLALIITDPIVTKGDSLKK